jgi:DNA-binding transcriptional regulator YiaG
MSAQARVSHTRRSRTFRSRGRAPRSSSRRRSRCHRHHMSPWDQRYPRNSRVIADRTEPVTGSSADAGGHAGCRARVAHGVVSPAPALPHREVHRLVCSPYWHRYRRAPVRADGRKADDHHDLRSASSDPAETWATASMTAAVSSNAEHVMSLAYGDEAVHIREVAPLTARDIARATGAGQSTVQAWLARTRAPSGRST